jgi:hypothetical protein
MRSDFKPTLVGLLANKYGLELVHFVMERRMLLGIKQRAERAADSNQVSAADRSPAGSTVPQR